MRYGLQLFILISLCSCNQSNTHYNSEKCDELSMGAFKGSPKSAHELQENCKNSEIHYTKELCQKALNDLIFGKNYESLKQNYGEKIAGCFSIGDIEKFASDEDKKILMNMNKE